MDTYEHIDIIAEIRYIVYRNSWIRMNILTLSLRHSVDYERNIDITADTLCRLETMDYFMNIFTLSLRHSIDQKRMDIYEHIDIIAETLYRLETHGH